MFSWEFCEISKDTFFTKHIWAVASGSLIVSPAVNYTLFFISNARLKFAKNQAKAKEHPQAELLLFDNYSLSPSRLSSKNNRRYSEKYTKNKCVCFNDVIWLMKTKTRLKIKNRSQIYDIIDLDLDVDTNALIIKCIPA